MQEWAWLNLNDFRGMVALAGERADPRRFRLAACACVRRVWHLLGASQLRTALELAEDWADHAAVWRELRRVRELIAASVQEDRVRFLSDEPAVPAWPRDHGTAAVWVWHREGRPVVAGARRVGSLLRSRVVDPEALIGIALSMTRFPDPAPIRPGLEAYCGLLRDIFGNPFRPVAFEPGWRSDTVVPLAKHMYESRDFSAMPILADALQDAGCENPDILDHCRDPTGVHVRGCWVVDLVLGKD